MKLALSETGDTQASPSEAPSGPTETIDPPAECDETPAVRIVAASGIAPVIEKLATDVCAEVTVTSNDDPQSAAALAAGEADVWVPDSSVRAVLAGKKAAAQAVSVASSPIVLATDPGLDTSGFTEGGGTSWGLMLKRGDLKPLDFEIVDPAKSSTSLVVADTLRGIARGATGDKFLGLAATAAAMTDLPVAEQAELSPGAIRVTEARLLAELENATIIPTAEGSPQLDYPWVASPALAGSAEGEAAAELLAQFETAEGKDALAEQGLLVAGRKRFDPLGTGELQLPLMATPQLAAIPSLYALAESGGQRGNSLAVLDVSGSMANAAGPGQPTPMEGVKASATLATGFLSDETSLGLWQFGYLLAPPKDYQQLVKVAPLGKNRKQLRRAINKMTPLRTGTSLYRTILEANRHVQKKWKPNHNNTVVVFTDGRNEDAPNGINLRQLLAKLKAERDPKRPVQMILFGYGEADTKALKRIATGSGGLTYKIDRPEQIVGAFIDAIAQSVLAGLED